MDHYIDIGVSDSEAYRDAVQNIHYWQQGQHFFTCELYSLLVKADHKNFAKLSIAFPIEVKAFSDWRNSREQDKFFEEVLGQ